MGAISAPEAVSEPEGRPRKVPWGRVASGAGRLLRSEGAVAFYFGLLISVVFNFQLVLHPRSLITGGLGDPLLQAWELAWVRRFLTEGGSLWTANQFYPAVDNFAFTDSLLGYLPLSLIGGDGQYDAILRYNVAFVLAFALAFTGAYLLAKQLGSNWQGAALAGLVFAWAPWRLTHLYHLNIVSTGGIALALWALAKGHGYSFHRERAASRPWWIFAGWLIAAWQVSIGFAIGLPFAHVMGVIGIVIIIAAWRRRSRSVVIANAYGAVVFIVVTWLLIVPYFRVVDLYGFKRTWEEVGVFSPPVNGLWTTSYETWLWAGSVFTDHTVIPEPGVNEKLLFPGLVVVLLAVIGLFVSAWRVRVRVMLAAAVVVSAVLALGVNFLGGAVYEVLWDYLPGWNALRTPGRIMIWALLPLGLLAAGAVTEFGRLLVVRTQVSLKLIAIYLLVPALAVLVESIPRMPYAQNPGIPPDLERVFTQAQEPLLVLPTGDLINLTYLLWSTNGFPTMANGNSGNFPESYREIANVTRTFPDEESLLVLRNYGIRKVIVIKSQPHGVDYASRPVAGLPVERTESNDIVEYTIKD